mgnify:CR=1 FL=1
MKALILILLIWIIPLAFAKESAWENTPINKIRYSVFNRMTFRKPVVFTPFDVKVGYLYYGKENYWSQLPYNSSNIAVTDSPVLLDSTQYEFNIIEKIANRKGLFIEANFLRTNLTHFIFHQNFIDLQMGIGIQMINYLPKLSLPSDIGKVWQAGSSSGNYYFNPKSIGINLNTSLGWQLSRRRFSYICHSLGISSVSLYESVGGDKNLSGIGISESFGIGTKYIFRQERANYNYTLGIEVKWSRLYMTSVDAPEGLSPIHGIDIRASGIFLTSGIQFGGRHTQGDIAYSQLMHNDFMSASESFHTFLDQEARHFKRKKAIKMLQYCESQIPYQKVKLGVDAYLQSDFDEALEWFNSAISDADETLKEKIWVNLQYIATELLDSVENYKNKMSIINAEEIATLAGSIYSESKRYPQVMADLYMDKAKLNTKIGNYSGAINNYKRALQFYPELEYIITEKLHGIANSLIKEAYLSYHENEIYMVLKAMKDFTQLQPQMSKELNPYILKLEIQIEGLHSKKINQAMKKYIIDKKHESLNLPESVLQLGMTYEEAKNIQGAPQFIDKHSEKDQYFEMWTYPEGKDVSQLYFKNNMLIRVEK